MSPGKAANSSLSTDCGSCPGWLPWSDGTPDRAGARRRKTVREPRESGEFLLVTDGEANKITPFQQEQAHHELDRRKDARKRGIMSVHKSLASKGSLIRSRNVLTRFERILQLRKSGRWTEGEDSPYGLAKVRVLKVKKRVKEKKKKEETAAAPGAPAPAQAAQAPQAAAAPAKGAPAAKATPKAATPKAAAAPAASKKPAAPPAKK